MRQLDRRILLSLLSIFIFATLSAQNKIELGINYSPEENLTMATDFPNMLYKFGAYGEYRWTLGKHFEAGARLDAKIGPIGPSNFTEKALAVSGDLLAIADFNLFPGKTVNPFIGLGLGPGFGMHNDKLDHLWSGQFLVFADARVGIELFRHLRFSVDYSLPSWWSYGEIYTTLNANIGWVF